MPQSPTGRAPGAWQKLLNPYGLSRRGQVLSFLLCVCLAVLIVDRTASYLFWPQEGSRQVLLVSSPHCPHSRAVREHLLALDVPFRQVDSRRDPLMSGLAGWAFQSVSVPILVVGTEVIYGDRRGLIDAALAEVGYHPPQQADAG